MNSQHVGQTFKSRILKHIMLISSRGHREVITFILQNIPHSNFFVLQNSNDFSS